MLEILDAANSTNIVEMKTYALKLIVENFAQVNYDFLRLCYRNFFFILNVKVVSIIIGF